MGLYSYSGVQEQSLESGSGIGQKLLGTSSSKRGTDLPLAPHLSASELLCDNLLFLSTFFHVKCVVCCIVVNVMIFYSFC